MKTRLLSTLGLAGFNAMLLAQSALGAVTVRTVPWIPTNPTSPHSTYATSSTTEMKIILGATVPSAVGSTDKFTVDWHFGDGSADTTFALTNPYDISTTHQYPASAAVGTTWTATVTVTDTTNSTSGSASYYVFQQANAGSLPALRLQAKVNVAIDWGLWYMHQTMWRGTTTVNSKTVNWGGWDYQPGSPGTCPTVNGNQFDCSSYGVSDAENVQAFEINGHLQNGPASDPYTDDVARGLARMFVFLTTQTAASDTYTYNPATANYTCADGSVPTTTDPKCSSHGGQHFYTPGATSCTSPSCVFTFDGNKNGIQTYSTDGSGEYSYTTSPFIDALVAAGTPNATAPTGAAGIQGETFATIIQDMVDFYNYSQYGSDYDVAQGYTRGASQYQGGAWLYGPQQGDDNSTSQWAAIGLISAARGLGVSVPSIVTDTNNVWVTNSEDVTQAAPTGADSFSSSQNLGSYGYRGSWAYSQEWGPFAMTPSAMVQMALDGVGRTTNSAFGDSSTNFDQRWNLSETFYADNFCNNVSTYGNGGYNNAYYAPRAYMYGMFSFTKAMLLHNVNGNLAPIQYLRTLTPNVFTTNSSVPKNTIDWYAALSSANGGTDPCDGVAQTLVNYQLNPASGVFDGHWWGFTASVGNGGQSPYETAWALIMLQKTVFVSCVKNLVGRGTPAGSAPARIDLVWSAQGQANSYNVLRGTSNGGPYNEIGSTTSTAFSDRSGLSDGDTYYYVVQPVNSSKTEICQSNQATVTVPK